MIVLRAASRYAFKAGWKKSAAAAFDALGSALARRSRSAFPKSARRVAVLRLDQIGDAVFADPFLRSLRGARPGLEIVFITTPAGAELYRPFAKDYRIESIDVDWFSARPSLLKSLRDWFRLRSLLRALAPDAVFDLRGDLRHVAAARSGLPRAWIASFGSTGGGFWLDWAGSESERFHASTRNLELTRSLGLEPSSSLPELSPALGALPLSREIESRLPAKDAPWIALHASAGTPSKLWPVAYWKTFVGALAGEGRAVFFWIGDAGAAGRSGQIAAFLPAGQSEFHDLCGKIPLSQLGTFLRRCDLFVTHDSGPAHVAAAQRVKTLVLFSGANELFEWKPLGDAAHALYHRVPCTPCHEKICPLPRHTCMEGIAPEKALELARKLLRDPSAAKGGLRMTS